MSFPGNNQPNLDSGIVPPDGGTGSGGGGSSPTGNPTVNFANITSTGGLSGSQGAVLAIGKNPFSSIPQVWKFDATNFNCEDDCEYHFKTEEVEVYRQPTVTKAIFRYRDLGKFTFVCFIQGNVLGQLVVSKIVTVVAGGNNDNEIYTTSADITFTCEAPRLIVLRSASQGALSFTKVLLEMQHGDTKPI